MGTKSDKGTFLAVMLGSLSVGALLYGIVRRRSGANGHGITPVLPFTENRVRVSDYGVLAANDSRLTDVLGGRVHHALARRFHALEAAAKEDGYGNLRIASGWRPHRWSSWDEYVDFVTRKYGSLEKGRKVLAFNSPHETGLGIDFSAWGLYPTLDGSKGPWKLNNAEQKQTGFYKWLKANAHKFGFSPYEFEAWHWETRIPLSEWNSPKPWKV